jgi:hypothetical protein
MMRLDTKPMTPGLRTGRGQADEMPLLIQVPRFDEPHGRAGFWRSRDAGHGRVEGRDPFATFRPAGRRRRLRRGVRRAGWSLLVLAAMAGTFAMGWTTRGGSARLPLLRTAALARGEGTPGSLLGGRDRRSDVDAGVADLEADALVTGPALDAPVAEAEVPVVFPGYLLPDNNREEPAHEGS